MDVNEQFDEIFTTKAADDLQAEVDAFEAAQTEEAAEEPSEPVEEPKAEVKEEPKEQKADTVPLAVFLDLKSELKELRRELESAKRPPAPEKPPETAPEFVPSVSYEDDPATFLKERTEHLERLVGWQAKQLGQTQQMTQEQRQSIEAQRNFQAFASAVSSSEEQFRSEAPDYDDAVEFMRESRFREASEVYQANGLEVNPQTEQQIRSAITREFASLAQNALSNGRSPASVLYRLAKARGYAGKKSEEAKVARIEKGVQASKSSQAVGGSAPASGEGGDFWKSLQRSAGYRG